MNKKFLLMFVVLLVGVGVNCFAQKLSPEAKALQGKWELIAALNDQESYDERAIKAEGLEIYYVFSGDNLTIQKPDEVVGPVRFEPAVGYLHLGPSGEAKLPYNLQGKILIIHEGNYAYVYRKK